MQSLCGTRLRGNFPSVLEEHYLNIENEEEVSMCVPCLPEVLVHAIYQLQNSNLCFYQKIKK